ncbi:Apolipoprotein N-acyltransferase [Neochlamydia sp. S13]|nr:Apolipoprotein N-acyltransferase [Neochlamydia sp. S13]
MLFHNTASYVKYVEAEWQQILMLCKEHLGKNIHLIALPEFIVPFTTYTPVYSYKNVKKIFLEVFGEKAYSALPLLQEPLASKCMTEKGSIWMVTNGYWLQGLANIFNAPVLSGMEDVEDFFDGHREYYSSAQFVEPSSYQQFRLPFKRYDKRVLVPMGEYIPFSFCRSLAAAYGITGSFTPGKEAKIFPAYAPFGASICYEETFGHLMRENRLKGAELIVNLTSDVWYPTVAQQHCDHARLRTTENGIPLIRACNTGITGGFDAFGREIKILGNTYYEKIWKPGALYLQVPLFSYKTLYSITGDYLIVFLCIVGIGGASFFRR